MKIILTGRTGRLHVALPFTTQDLSGHAGGDNEEDKRERDGKANQYYKAEGKVVAYRKKGLALDSKEWGIFIKRKTYGQP